MLEISVFTAIIAERQTPVGKVLKYSVTLDSLNLLQRVAHCE